MIATSQSVNRLPEGAAGVVSDARGGEHIHWHNAWTEYVRGHVVSVTAAALIQSFLLKTLAASGGSNDADAQSEKV